VIRLERKPERSPTEALIADVFPGPVVKVVNWPYRQANHFIAWLENRSERAEESVLVRVVTWLAYYLLLVPVDWIKRVPWKIRFK